MGLISNIGSFVYLELICIFDSLAPYGLLRYVGSFLFFSVCYCNTIRFCPRGFPTAYGMLYLVGLIFYILARFEQLTNCLDI